jgi:hypothetical protein
MSASLAKETSPTNQRGNMHWYHREPTLKEMLSDSIVRAVMRADGVHPHEIEAILVQVSPRPLPYPPPQAGEGWEGVSDEWIPWPPYTGDLSYTGHCSSR